VKVWWGGRLWRVWVWCVERERVLWGGVSGEVGRGVVKSVKV